MKTSAIHPAIVAFSTFALGLSVNARDPSAAPAPPPSTTETSENNAAAAAADRRPMLSQTDTPLVSDQNMPGAVSASSKALERQSAHSLDGRWIHGRDGKALGKIADFLIDPPSGEICYAVVSSSHRKLRLVPFQALRPDRTHRGDFSLSITEAEWNGLGTLDEAEFKSGYITVSDGERRSLAQRFESAPFREAALSAYYTQDISSHLVRADFLRGRDVFVAGKRIGSVKELIVNQEAATASALFDPSWRFTSAKEKFVVPLNRYSFGATRDEPVMTDITREDFDAMRALAHLPGSALRTPSTSVPPVSAEHPTALSPTGRSSSEQQPSGASPESLVAAKAIRAALDQEEAGARIVVDVNPQNSDVVLRGSVADIALRQSIEEKAGQVAKGVQIDFQIAVENNPSTASKGTTTPANPSAATPQPAPKSPR